MSKLYDDLVAGLNEAIDFEKGEVLPMDSQALTNEELDSIVGGKIIEYTNLKGCTYYEIVSDIDERVYATCLSYEEAKKAAHMLGVSDTVIRKIVR